MTPEQARNLKSELEAANREIEVLTSGMDAGALMRRPPEGGWSVGENLQHLLLTVDAMMPLSEKAIEDLESRGLKSSRRTGLGLFGWMLVKSLEPPPRMKTKTIPPFEPVAVGDPLSLSGRLQEAHRKVATLIDRAQGLATGRVKLVSPFNARVSYNLYAAFRIVLVHTRRHLWQAGRAKAGATAG